MRCLQKIVSFRTFVQRGHIVFALKVWERLWRDKRDHNVEVCRRLGRVTKKYFSLRQSRTKFMKQCQEIKQNWTGQENFEICFCVIFSQHCFINVVHDCRLLEYTVCPPFLLGRGCLERGGDLFQGGCSFYIKNKLNYNI